MSRALALDSVLCEVAFVLGPLLVGAALAVTGPWPARCARCLLRGVGTASFTALLARQPGPPIRTARHNSRLGALSSRGIRILSLISVPLGFYLGTLEIALPAIAGSANQPAVAGVLLAVFAAASGISALTYGSLQPTISIWILHLGLSAALAVAALPILAISDLRIAVPLIAIAGVPVGPLIVLRNELVRDIAPVGTQAEAFAWPLTAMTVGTSIGAAVGGRPYLNHWDGEARF